MPAATTAPTTDAAPKSGGRKKLVVLIAGAVLLIALLGTAVAVVLKKRTASENDDAVAESEAATTTHKAELKAGKPPVFLPLEPFTVNLADRDAERYAQLGVTLELDDTKTGDLVKAYMPAIRNNVLMLLAAKTAAELLSHEGKLALARDIRSEALRPLGVSVADERGGAPRVQQIEYPIRAVHFSNLIVQ